MIPPYRWLHAWWVRQPLHVQVAILATMVIVVAAALGAYVVSRAHAFTEDGNRRTSSMALVESIAMASAFPIRKGDLEVLEKLALSSVDLPGVRALKVLDAMGRPLTHVVRAESGGAVQHTIEPQLMEETLRDAKGAIARRTSEELEVWRRIDDGELLGWMAVTFSPEPAIPGERLFWRDHALLGLFTLAAGLAVLWLVLKLRMSALSRATHFAGQLGGWGEQRLALPANSREVNDLVVALNQAADALQQERRAVVESRRLAEASAIELEATRMSLEKHVKEHTRQLSWQSTHDALTGLANRVEFERRLQELLESARNKGKRHALVYFDLDRFKIVNDTAGHLAGDEVLRQVAALLSTKVNHPGTLARLGGDEFGMLLENCELQAAQCLAQDLVDAVRSFRFMWNQKNLGVGLSAGLVAINASSDGITQVLSDANMAYCMAKERGPNTVHVYQADDRELVQRRSEMRWLAILNNALEENRFRLYRQPIIPLAATPGAQLHCEVLLRLIDETGYVVSPAEFLPAAERYHLISTIDRWVAEALFRFLVLQERHGTQAERKVIYAMNISGASLSEPSFLDFVRDRLRCHRVPAQRICFEITETAVISNMHCALRFIKELKGLGCRFALDDFGTGLSSFSYLQSLSVDYIKIDGSFVRNMLCDPMAYAIVNSVNNLAHAVGLKTIAEYVDQRGLLERLSELGVDYVQGYHLASPDTLDLRLELKAFSGGRIEVS